MIDKNIIRSFLEEKVLVTDIKRLWGQEANIIKLDYLFYVNKVYSAMDKEGENVIIHRFINVPVETDINGVDWYEGYK